MSNRVKTLNDLKDSRLLFDKNPPAFGYFIIFIVGVFLCATLIWSIHTSKVYTIHASGIVTNEESNYVMCTYTGEIIDCNLKEGMLVEEGDVLFNIKSTDYNVQAEQLKESRKIYEDKIERYRLLINSIKDDVNYFNGSDPNDELYYSAFEIYKSKVAQNILDASIYAAYGYTDEQIEAELKKNQGKISEIYYEAIGTAESAIVDAQTQIGLIDAQFASIGLGQSEYAVKATSSGTLHLLNNYQNGMVVQTMQVVATITPDNEEKIIEVYVSPSDMVRINEGDSVQIVVDGLPQNIYGTISGRVKQIDSNVTSQESSEGSNVQVFKVLISMDNDYFVSKSGDKVNVTNGMTVVTRISYDKITYFDYMLEKLGIKIYK